MSHVWSEEIDEISRRQGFAELLGGVDKIRRQHENGRSTVRERITELLDDDSFEEIGALAGFATVADDGTVVPVPGDPGPGDEEGDPTAPSAPTVPGAGAAQPGSGLAVTGADVTLLAALALLLAAAGAVTVRTVRRRRGTAG